jgi:glutamate N-acetyltransferase/amino-acid N-acetyltransferase
MIYPVVKTEMHATMLCFITTDAAISKKMLESALSEATQDSFNMVSVDGDMSTNDSCFVLANGLACNKRIDTKGSSYKEFVCGLKRVAIELAKMVARDGEGATKFVEIDIRGARDKRAASIIARKVSTSSLLKCCIFGEDPNWGRIAAAAGAGGVDFDPGKTDIYIGAMKVFSSGASLKSFNKEKARRIFKEHDIRLIIDLKSGKASATAWTCDFSKDYVAINSEYST